MAAVCEHLQAVTDGRIKRLLITIPPGHAKSMLVSVLWPAWTWARRPAWRALFGSYALDLALRDAVKARTLIEGPWYTERFRKGLDGRPAFELADDQNAKGYYRNSLFGERLSVSVGSKATGFRGDGQVIDDPLNAMDAHSDVAREEARRWFFETMSSRLNDMASGFKVVIAQRLHEQDVPGHILAQASSDGEYWDHLDLPSEYDPEARCRCPCCAKGETSIGWKDPRTKKGELLFPVMFPPKVIAQAKVDLGSYGYAAQHAQKPYPAEGGMLKAVWFSRVWREPGQAEFALGEHEPGLEVRTIQPRVGKFEAHAIITDAAFKKTSDSDFVAIGVIGKKGPDIYLLDLVWERLGFNDTIKAILELRRKWPRVTATCIEDKANGSAIIETLKEKIPGVIAIEPLGGKEARIAAAAPFIEAGNLWLPLHHSKRRALVGEATAFPKGAHDDGIDMLAHAILKYGGLKSALLKGLVRWGPVG